jgi:hypothetical protein
MKTINVSQPLPDGAARFAAAKSLAATVAESDSELIEPELVAWIDRSSTLTSPVFAGRGGPEAWRDYGVSHGGSLEVDVGDDTAFIFVESSQFDSYDHFGHGPFRNLRDAQGNEYVCNTDGAGCVPLDEWTSKLT